MFKRLLSAVISTSLVLGFALVRNGEILSAGSVTADSRSVNVKTVISNEEVIYSYLTDNLGFNNAASSGILANIQLESAFDPKAGEGNGGNGYGLCQWTGSRRNDLVSWCKKNGYDYTSIEGQLSFLKYELKNRYSSVYLTIVNAADSEKGAAEVAYSWCMDFERPEYKNKVHGQYDANGNRCENGGYDYFTSYKKTLRCIPGRVGLTESEYRAKIASEKYYAKFGTAASVPATSVPSSAPVSAGIPVTVSSAAAVFVTTVPAATVSVPETSSAQTSLLSETTTAAALPVPETTAAVVPAEPAVTTTPVPAAATTEPAATTPVSVMTTTEPVTTTPVPVTTTTEPVTTTPVPVTTATESVTTTQTPETTSAEPETTTTTVKATTVKRVTKKVKNTTASSVVTEVPSEETSVTLTAAAETASSLPAVTSRSVQAPVTTVPDPSAPVVRITKLPVSSVNGDFNGDGKVDAADIIIIKNVLINVDSEVLSPELFDLNKNGVADSDDYRIVKKIVLEK